MIFHLDSNKQHFFSSLLLSVSSLGSGSACSGREGGRINADRRFSSGWIQVGWRVSIAYHSLTVHLPLSHSNCTCPLVNSMRCFSFAALDGAVDCWLCVARCLFSRPFTGSDLYERYVWLLIVPGFRLSRVWGLLSVWFFPSSSRQPLLHQPEPVLHARLDRSGNEGRQSFVPLDCFQC